MDKSISDKLLKLKVGRKIKINGKTYTIKEKQSNEANDEYHSDTTRYELGNDYILEYGWSWHFFQLVKKINCFLKLLPQKLFQ